MTAEPKGIKAGSVLPGNKMIANCLEYQIEKSYRALPVK